MKNRKSIKNWKIDAIRKKSYTVFRVPAVLLSGSGENTYFYCTCTEEVVKSKSMYKYM